MALPPEAGAPGKVRAWGGGLGIMRPFSLGAKAVGFTAPAPCSLQQFLPPAGSTATTSGRQCDRKPACRAGPSGAALVPLPGRFSSALPLGPAAVPLAPFPQGPRRYLIPWREGHSAGGPGAGMGGAVPVQGLTHSPGSQRHVDLSACLSPGRCQRGAGLLPTAPRGQQPRAQAGSGEPTPARRRVETWRPLDSEHMSSGRTLPSCD